MQGVTVLIPSLNPDENLLELTRNLHKLGLCDIVIVNDGSDPSRLHIFDTLANEYHCTIVTHTRNEGKGAALKTGIAAIKELYPNSAGFITADADGQHSPEDILHIARVLFETASSPGMSVSASPAIALGVRDFNQENVPPKSRYGNKITSAVFFFATGRRCSDTQTGLRGFPLSLVDELLQITGKRFEYETNMLIKLARSGVKFIEIQIETIYNNGNRETHFRPFKDSILIYGQFFKFVLSSLLSAVLDIALFTLFRKTVFASVAKSLIFSTVSARILSGIFNYTINKNAVFKNNEKSVTPALKYFALFLSQMLLSSLFVDITSQFKINITLLKIFIDTLLFVLSFAVQKLFVFNNQKVKR